MDDARASSNRVDYESYVGKHLGAAKRVNGGYSERDPPLPIPNREVKPFSADDTASLSVGK